MINPRQPQWSPAVLMVGVLLPSTCHLALGQTTTQQTQANLRVVQRLIDEIQSSDRNARRRAKYTTHRLIGPNHQDGVPLLVDALESSGQSGRTELIAALVRIGPAAVPHLVKTIDNGTLSRRLGAISALGGIRADPKSSIPCLIRALADDRAEVRRASIISIQRFQDSAKEAVPSLAAIAIDDTNIRIRVTAVVALGQIHLQPDTSVPCLIRALGDESPAVRRAAADALSEFDSKAEPAFPALAQAFDDEDKSVRKRAVRTIGELGQDAMELVPTLLKYLHDDDPSMSREVSAALRRIKPEGQLAVRLLLGATKDARPHVRRNAVWVLGSTADLSRQAMPRLIELLKDEDPTIVRATLRALSASGADATRAVPRIIEIIKSKNRVLSALAEQTLRKVAPDQTAELIGIPYDTVQARLHDILDFDVGEQDWPQLGGSRHRNNTPDGKNIPTSWHPGRLNRRTGEWISDDSKNIKWVARLGSQSYGNPVVANGKVYVGTNNGAGYLKRYPPKTDLGCLLCFEASTGDFLWQHSSEKLATGRVHDWPLQGICSSPIIDGDRLWFVTNRGEVVCLDTDGFHDNEDDGSETHVWSWLFDAAHDLGPLQNLTVGSAIPDALRPTLATILRTAGLRATGRLRIRTVHEPGVFTIGGYTNRHAICRLRFTSHALQVLTVDGRTRIAEMSTSLLEGLDDGRLATSLQAQFRGSNVDVADELDIQVAEPGRSWKITFGTDDQRREFRLVKKGQQLVCDERITTDLERQADVVWKFDMMKNLGVSQHNMATCGPTIWGQVLFICTSNGVDESHIKIPAPEAPSFIAMNKNTGEVLWTDNSPGANILHGQWSCPVVGVFDGIPQVIFPGGDGWLYSFRADRWKDGKPELVWTFDANPKASEWILGGRGTRNSLIAVPVIYDGLVYVPVGQDPEHGEGEGHLWCIDPTRRGDVSAELVVDASGALVPHRRRQAAVEWEAICQVSSNVWDSLDEGILSESLRREFRAAGHVLPRECGVETDLAGRRWTVRAKVGGTQERYRLTVQSRRARGNEIRQLIVERKTEETIKANPNSAVVWHYDKFDADGDGEFEFGETMHRTIGSPTIKNDLLMITDFSGLVHCVNAKTGIPYWTCDLLAACWGTPMIVEDKVYIGDEDGDVAIFDLSPDPSRFTLDDGDDDWDGLVPLHEINMGNSVYTTPIVADNVLYIANKTHLFAIEAQGE